MSVVGEVHIENLRLVTSKELKYLFQHGEIFLTTVGFGKAMPHSGLATDIGAGTSGSLLMYQVFWRTCGNCTGQAHLFPACVRSTLTARWWGYSLTRGSTCITSLIAMWRWRICLIIYGLAIIPICKACRAFRWRCISDAIRHLLLMPLWLLLQCPSHARWHSC